VRKTDARGDLGPQGKARGRSGGPPGADYRLLDNIRSLYNVGSIFRSSDGAFIQELLLTGYTPRPPRPEIDKTAWGPTETVPWAYYRNPSTRWRRHGKKGRRSASWNRPRAAAPITR